MSDRDGERAEQIRLGIATPSFGAARRVAALLEEIAWPPPIAVSLFADASTPSEPGSRPFGPVRGETNPHGTWADDVTTPVGRHTVHAYFENAEAASAARNALIELGELTEPNGWLEPVPDLDWVRLSQEALPPVQAGRFLVHGSHDRARIGRRQWAIEIDAGEAFGTAHHATTLGCLLALDRLARRHRARRVLDLGCGTGVLAIAAAKAWPAARLLASDIDPEAVRVARANIRLAGLARRIGVAGGDGLSGKAIRRAGPFDLVLANILAGPLIRLAPGMARAVAPGGLAVLSGLLVGQEREVRAAYHAAGFAMVGVERLNGWSVLVLQRRR